MPPWEVGCVTDRKFSTVGKAASAFEHELLAHAAHLEDPWVEIAGIIGLDKTLLVMDRFARCLLSVPARDAFVARMHRVWLDDEVLRLSRIRPRLSNADIESLLHIPRNSLRRKKARALKRCMQKRA